MCTLVIWKGDPDLLRADRRGRGSRREQPALSGFVGLCNRELEQDALCAPEGSVLSHQPEGTGSAGAQSITRGYPGLLAADDLGN